MINITDRPATLFDLDQYECDSLVQWGWLEPSEPRLGSNKNLLPNSPQNLLPNPSVREQNENLLPNLEIVKVKGRSYFLTPTKPIKPKPKERSWYDIKIQKGHEYLYLRWREDKTQKSRCLGRLDEIKYTEPQT